MLGGSVLLHLAAEMDALSARGLILGRGFSVGYECILLNFRMGCKSYSSVCGSRACLGCIVLNSRMGCKCMELCTQSVIAGLCCLLDKLPAKTVHVTCIKQVNDITAPARSICRGTQQEQSNVSFI